MILRVYVSWVDTSLTDSSNNSLLNLLFLSLLDSNTKFLILYRLSNRSLIKSNWFHSSNLHSNLMSSLLVVLVQKNHSSESVLTHVIVYRYVLTLQEVVAIKLHLLTGNTRAMLYSSLSVIAVSELKSLNLVKVLALVSDSSVKDFLNHCDEVFTSSNEVSLTLNSNHCCEIVYLLYEDTTIRSLTVRTLCSDSKTTLTNELDCLINITISLSQRFLTVSKTSTCHLTKLLDISYRYSHNIVSLFFIN